MQRAKACRLSCRALRLWCSTFISLSLTLSPNPPTTVSQRSLVPEVPFAEVISKKLSFDLMTGFAEARRACCGTGLLETSILCNPKSVGTCANASEYVFWDGFHPSEATNRILADDLLAAGISLLF